MGGMVSRNIDVELKNEESISKGEMLSKIIGKSNNEIHNNKIKSAFCKTTRVAKAKKNKNGVGGSVIASSEIGRTYDSELEEGDMISEAANMVVEEDGISYDENKEKDKEKDKDKKIEQPDEKQNEALFSKQIRDLLSDKEIEDLILRVNLEKKKKEEKEKLLLKQIEQLSDEDIKNIMLKVSVESNKTGQVFSDEDIKNIVEQVLNKK